MIDGDTVELADGRRIGLLGVDAPAAETCAGPGATEFTRSKVQGQTVKLHREPGVITDQDGRTLGYLQYGAPNYANDLGDDLVMEGWAKTADNGANPAYMDNVKSSADIAEFRSRENHGEPCGEPKVYGDDNGGGTPDYKVDVDVDAPHVNLPDGALTGGFCARKWWC
ncbi:thermonuclease family protein [Saccharopolyspora phatthalungensis]|uniref:Endonuclease YncB(Thermonuclease family) n=1 Tax=Saccharopolyspora phatthalungensis TaxID=664693 RepID=A0A840Q622_9PSEU|nr:thermonuclease family protein [Saccharopolyspora phatthalungensis]MBB5156074.1 endonuclease YncB(thermonuclease family) [Saccharopolyspora phatthalungensis]